MTKSSVDEGLPKFQMPLDDANRIIESNMRMLHENRLAIGSLPSHAAARPKFKINSLKTRLEKIMRRLYDLEPSTESEKPLNVDLCVDLYQMEDY